MTLRLEIGNAILELTSDPFAISKDKRLLGTTQGDLVQQWRVRAPDLHAAALVAVPVATLAKFCLDLDGYCLGLVPEALLEGSRRPNSFLQVTTGGDGIACLVLALHSGEERTQVQISARLSAMHLESLRSWASHIGRTPEEAIGPQPGH